MPNRYGRSAARAAIAAVAMPALLMSAAFAQPEPADPAPSITVELNKLESVGTACLAYLVVHNGTGEPIATMALDTYVFDASGGITARFAIAFAGLRANGDRVFGLTIENLACESVGRLLVNDVTTCERASGLDTGYCAGLLVTSSRATAGLDY